MNLETLQKMTMEVVVELIKKESREYYAQDALGGDNNNDHLLTIVHQSIEIVDEMLRSTHKKWYSDVLNPETGKTEPSISFVN